MSLTNGIAYHYRIYARDSRGNYSQTGVVPTRSPATPVATYDYSGIAYASDGTTPLTSKTVRLYQNGTTLLGTDTTNASTGAWSISTQTTVSSGDILTLYIDNDAVKGNTIFKTNGSDHSGVNILSSTLSLIDYSATNITNANLSTGYVSADVTDMVYGMTGNNITSNSGIDLRIYSGTYTPGGDITTQGTGGLYIDTGATATFNNPAIIAGNVVVNSGGNFNGSGAVTINGGSLTGDGIVSNTGTITLGGTGNFGGVQNWSLNQLTLGTGGVATTTAIGSGSITLATTTISASHVLDAGSKTWNLTGIEPLQVLGTLVPSSSTFSYQNNSFATVTPITYNNIAFEPSSGSATFRVPTSSTGAEGWYENGGTWSNRKKITIDNTRVSGSSNLTDFPVLVDITDADLASKALSTGYDILFTSADGTTKLAHEIELYTNSTGRLTAWVKIPTLSYNADTEIYMYYGNSEASDQQNKTGVWDSYYKAVYHLSESLSTASGNYKDSTSNANNLTLTDADADTITTSKFNGGLHFAGDADYLSAPSANSLNVGTNSFTYSFWHKRASYVWAEDSTLAQKANQYSGSNPGWNIAKSGSTAVFQYRKGGGTIVTLTSPTGFWDGGDWIHITMAYDASAQTMSIYRNGVLNTSNSSIAPANIDNTTPLGIGARYVGVYEKFDNREHDEHRYSVGIARSADWIATEYNNQSATSTFYTIGTEENPTSSGTTFNVSNNLVLGGTGNATLDLNTNDSGLVVGNNMTIGSGDTLSAPSTNTITVGGNFANSGTFTHNNGEIVFNKRGVSNITSSANIEFYTFTSETPGKTLVFQGHSDNAPVFNFVGRLNIVGRKGDPVLIESSVPGTPWLAQLSGSENTVNFVSLRDSGCYSGTLALTVSANNTDRGNNGTCWGILTRGSAGFAVGVSGSSLGVLRTGGNVVAVSTNQSVTDSNDSLGGFPVELNGIIGQTFTPSVSGKISNAVFALYQEGSPVGTLTAYLYPTTGTFGTNELPTGSPLATSNSVAANSLNPMSPNPQIFYFPDNQTYNLVIGNSYALVVKYTEGGATDRVIIDYNISGLHPGRVVTSVNDGESWSSDSGDLYFQVSVIPDVSTDGISGGGQGQGGGTVGGGGATP